MILHNTHLFIDFDSTFNQVESLDTLIELSITDEKERKKVLEEIVRITNLAMAGKLDYMESLKSRIGLLHARKEDVENLADELYQSITPSIQQNRDILVANKENIYIISNGFKDFIVPVIKRFGLKEENVYANEFTFNEQGEVIGVDTNNPLSRSAGKPKVIRKLNLHGRIIVLGDGYNDYQIKKAGECDSFIVLTENVSREEILPLADYVAPTFHEVLKFIQQ